MTNNNQVNWDEIPEDVEAVVTFKYMQPSYYKHIIGMLYVQSYRGNKYLQSDYKGMEDIMIDAGDRFHLRPSPITQPTPELPESTQVESSEVEATTTPEFDWSSVDDDVEAVIVSQGEIVQWLKTEDGSLLRTNSLGKVNWSTCYYKTLDDREKNMCDYHDKEAKLLRRPPATTPPEEKVTGNVVFYKGELPEGMINLDVSTIQTETYTPKPPSISTILQEAQQSILKHHGVTGKVKFTVSCSE